jgi:ATP-dependent Zn protease
MNLFIALQQVNIEEKVNNAPNSNYQIGVAIGSFLPFIILIGIAYIMYYRAKKQSKE